MVQEKTKGTEKNNLNPLCQNNREFKIKKDFTFGCMLTVNKKNSNIFKNKEETSRNSP